MESLLVAHEPTLHFCALFLAIALVAVWEGTAPRRRLTASLRTRWLHNLAIWGLSTILTRLAFPVTGIAFALIAADRGWGLFNVVKAPAWLAIGASVLLLDLAGYLQHRLFHRLPLLWRFHRVHHADPDYDFTLGFRFHPLETAVGVMAGLGTIALIGAPVAAVLLHELGFVLVSVFAHANVGLPSGLEGRLRRVIVTPDLHRVHHSVLAPETDSNFGSILPWWDRFFGTYRDQPEAGHVDMRIGLEEIRGARCLTIGWMLIHPLIPARLERRLFGN